MNSSDVAVLADVHFGYAGNEFLDSELRFFREVLVPELKRRKIKKIIQLGDLFENRRNIDVYVKNKVYDLFENDLKDFEWYIFPGNHDVYFKNSNEIHSLRFLKKFKNVTVINDITEIEINKRKFLFVPWLYDLEIFKTYINEHDIKEVDACFGHFDIIGSKMSKNAFSKNGLTKDLLFKFKKVFSGHYHSRSIEKRGEHELVYVGMPYQLNRGDEGEERGFCILHCDDLSYEFVENNISIKYVSLKYPEKFEESQIKGNVIDIYISNNDGIDEIQSYIDEVNKYSPVHEPTKRFIDGLNVKDTKDIKVKNLKEMFDEYIEQLDIDDEIKTNVVDDLNTLYEDCQKDF